MGTWVTVGEEQETDWKEMLAGSRLEIGLDGRNCLRSDEKFIWPLCRAARARGSAMAGLGLRARLLEEEASGLGGGVAGFGGL